jgi:protein-tyrosine kinase
MSSASIRRFPTAYGAPEAVASDDSADGARQRIGELLVALGRLNHPQVSAVLARQAADPRRFGELAIALGLVTQSDIDVVLDNQRGIVDRGGIDRIPGSMVSPRSSPGNLETLLAVRAQLVHRWFGKDPEQRALAIVSLDRGDGRSWVASNLARLFAELDDDTLLIDADMRQPSLHQVYGVTNREGLSSFLSGRCAEAPIRAVPGIRHLDILAAGPAIDQPHKLVSHRNFALMLERLADRYSAIFVDTPPVSIGGDAITMALRCSGALLVTRRDRTRVADVAALSERLKSMTVEVVGAVINEVP